MSVCASLALAGCVTPRKPDNATRPQDPTLILAELAEYGAWVSRQPDAQIDAERQRLLAQSASADRDLRLALLHSQRTSAAYDPQQAAHLLTQIASQAKPSVEGHLAQILLAGLPDPQAYADANRIASLYSALTAQLAEIQDSHRHTELQLVTTRAELETERTERARLERQLQALKSLEAQIKDRDSSPVQ